MLLLKELPTTESLKRFTARYPKTDIAAISDFASLLKAASDISDALDKLLAKFGLLQGRWWVLILLMRQEDQTSTPSDLAVKTGVTKATMTGFINGLEKDGLITRDLGIVDRRQLMIKLTPKGQQKLDEVMPEYVEKVALLMNSLGREQKDILLANMNHLASNSAQMR